DRRLLPHSRTRPARGRGSVGDVLGVRDQKCATRPRLASSCQPLIRRSRLLDWENLLDKIVQLENAACLQVENAFHISLLRPADVADRVVESALFIVRVVSSGPVGARDPEPKLLSVERLARNINRNVSDEDEVSAVAGDVRR